MAKAEEGSSSETDDWQELTQSDYAKVIFSDLCHDSESGCVACKFQITDNVHEDPSDQIGVFRVGYKNITQYVVLKSLSETDCEEDGKLMRCQFRYDELPDLESGFYQFVYITRDKEVCGASMPFEIKQQLDDEEIIAENMEGDFLVVKRGLQKKNEELRLQKINEELRLQKINEALRLQKINEELIIRVQKYEDLNQMLTTNMKKLIAEKGSLYQEKEVVISNLKQDCLKMKKQLMKVKRDLKVQENSVQETNQQLQLSKAANLNLCDANALLRKESDELSGKIRDLESLLKEKETTISELTYAMETDKQMLFEQIEESKCMVQALEDSKHLAMKEMKNLSDNLSQLKVKNAVLVVKHEELEHIHAQVELKRLKEHNELKVTNAELAAKHEELERSHAQVVDELTRLKEHNETQVIAKDAESTARLTEAAELYKAQFKEIEQLKKKVDKLKRSKKDMEHKMKKKVLSLESTNKQLLEEKASELAANSTQIILPLHEGAPTELFRRDMSLTWMNFYKSIGWNQTAEVIEKKRKEAARKKIQEGLLVSQFACSNAGHSETEDSTSDSISGTLDKITPLPSECSDCDTGEHVLKEKTVKSLNAEDTVAVTGPIPASSHHLETEVQQDLIVVEKITAATQTPAELEKVDLPCSLCDDKIEVCAGESSEVLRLHYELKHGMQMCPVCGQLFESNFPAKYLMAHVNCHFKD